MSVGCKVLSPLPTPPALQRRVLVLPTGWSPHPLRKAARRRRTPEGARPGLERLSWLGQRASFASILTHQRPSARSAGASESMIVPRAAWRNPVCLISGDA